MSREINPRKSFWLLTTTLAVSVLATPCQATPHLLDQAITSLDQSLPATGNAPTDVFPRPEGLNDAVTFWRNVFGNWQAHQLILHDDTHLGVVYDTVEITGYIGGRLSAEQQAKVDAKKANLIAQLNDLEYRLKKRVGLTKEQQQYYKLLIRKVGPNGVRNAAQRVRVQRGMKESFKMGLEASGQYTGMMRKVFQAYGLPEALAYLPHVESAFTTSARSPAGAVGVWQFMPVTGKRYLRMDRSLDERYDPILATRGAAKYLAYAYDKLGHWGLAITSYNYGLSGALRARQAHGKNMARIVKQYDGARFGFASRNYYTEFLAVCDIMADLPRYFPAGIRYQQPPAIKPIEIKRDMTSAEIAKKYNVHYIILANLNPAWRQEAAEGKIAIPANTSVWLPVKQSRKTMIASANKVSKYLVSGNSSDKIDFVGFKSKPAVWNMLAAFPNGLSGKLVTALLQPKPGFNPGGIVTATKGSKFDSKYKPKTKPLKTVVKEVHIVQNGDSPYTIASKYSVHLSELLSVNDIEAGSLIRPGQSIIIPVNI